ncbi:MAG: hypothetical protein KKH51_02480 [Actinobacteria bacterium]|nr:hypothetical protein [Actinomycetota bacterium]
MRRPAITLAMIIIATLSLSGCDVLAPTRDADGKIVGAVEMPSTDAWVGDCFSFVDNSNLAYATVVPCSEPHTHVVIGRGTFTPQRIAHFESLQIAVLTACKDRFELYQATQEQELTPEYIVSDKKEHDGRVVTHYSCLVKNA